MKRILDKKSIVFVNGCFDILHRGHFELFKYAKSAGDYLIVAIDSDKRVRDTKGASRPFNTAADRKFALECIGAIDEVVVFGTSLELENTVKKIQPDVMIVGSDWRGKEIIGKKYCTELRFFDRIEGYSTTKVLESQDDLRF